MDSIWLLLGIPLLGSMIWGLSLRMKYYKNDTDERDKM